eukprot:gene5371-3866_t
MKLLDLLGCSVSGEQKTPRLRPLDAPSATEKQLSSITQRAACSTARCVRERREKVSENSKRLRKRRKRWDGTTETIPVRGVPLKRGKVPQALQDAQSMISLNCAIIGISTELFPHIHPILFDAFSSPNHPSRPRALTVHVQLSHHPQISSNKYFRGTKSVEVFGNYQPTQNHTSLPGRLCQEAMGKPSPRDGREVWPHATTTHHSNMHVNAATRLRVRVNKTNKKKMRKKRWSVRTLDGVVRHLWCQCVSNEKVCYGQSFSALQCITVSISSIYHLPGRREISCE